MRNLKIGGLISFEPNEYGMIKAFISPNTSKTKGCEIYLKNSRFKIQEIRLPGFKQVWLKVIDVNKINTRDAWILLGVDAVPKIHTVTFK